MIDLSWSQESVVPVKKSRPIGSTSYLPGGRTFIKLNCASLPENLLDSELFGYEPGPLRALDEAIKAGLSALTGTLFLDELGTMPLALQEKLLRVIEYGELEWLAEAKRLRSTSVS